MTARLVDLALSFGVGHSVNFADALSFRATGPSFRHVLISLEFKMSRAFAAALAAFVRTGWLEVETADGRVRTFGDGTGPRVGVKFVDHAAELKLMLDPELALGELYTDGRLEITCGSLQDFMELASRGVRGSGGSFWFKALHRVRIVARRLYQRNGRQRAKAHVARHYDHDARLYALFLDADLQYSCGYFEAEGATLEEAQLAKKRHVAAKLLVDAGHGVLDVGSGFGGMALHLAQVCGARVLGVTLSAEQHALACRRAEQMEVGSVVEFRLQDYRDVAEKFDRIVSIGMFEHVGAARYGEFFAKMRELLTDDGVMVLHAVGRSGRPGTTNPWIVKHIFPGSYAPSLSEVTAAIEGSGMLVTDVEILQLHYAETLAAWSRNFMARRDEAAALYGERFCRMWEFYLAGTEAAFRVGEFMVFQIQLAKRKGVAPMTRGYIAEREALQRDRERDGMAARRAAS